MPYPIDRFPKERMRNPLGLQPRPVLRRPPPWLAVPSRLHELEKLRIGHVGAIDGEIRHVGPTRRVLVVPPKWRLVAVHAERHGAAWHLDTSAGRDAPVNLRLVPRRTMFRGIGQAMPH